MCGHVHHSCLLFVLTAFLTSNSEGAVTRLSPTSGSLCGGTRLSIFGSGFANTTLANRVEVGGSECKIESAAPDVLVCKVPFRSQQVKTGKETVTQPVKVYTNGKLAAGALEFTFKAESSPIVVDWGPAAGQANDVVSFQGKNPLFGASVEMDGRECKVKHSEGIYLQCVPPPREAGLSSVEVYFGPDRGFACPGPKAQPLKFTYNLALQSASPSDPIDGESEGPLDGGGQLIAGPCSPRTPRSDTLTIVGQGLGESTVFKLCGGDTWCEREGPVTADPELYHGGDWSFQTVTCRPGPLDPSKAPNGERKCDLTAEGADGMFVATLEDVWTYKPVTTPPPAAAGAPAPPPGAPAAAPAASTPTQVYIGASPAAMLPGVESPPVIYFGGPSPAPPTVQAPAPAPAAPVAPPTLPPTPLVPAPTPQPPAQPKDIQKKVLKNMAADALAGAFRKLGRLLGGSEKAEKQSLKPQQPETPALPPPYPVPLSAFKTASAAPTTTSTTAAPAPPPPPPPSTTKPPLPPAGLFEAAPPAPAAVAPPAVALLHTPKAAIHKVTALTKLKTKQQHGHLLV